VYFLDKLIKPVTVSQGVTIGLGIYDVLRGKYVSNPRPFIPAWQFKKYCLFRTCILL